MFRILETRNITAIAQISNQFNFSYFELLRLRASLVLNVSSSLRSYQFEKSFYLVFFNKVVRPNQSIAHLQILYLAYSMRLTLLSCVNYLYIAKFQYVIIPSYDSLNRPLPQLSRARVPYYTRQCYFYFLQMFFFSHI